jgi:hypothetical protein
MTKRTKHGTQICIARPILPRRQNPPPGKWNQHMRRAFAVLLLLAVVALGIFWFVQRQRTRALNSGDVFVREQPGENPKPLPPPAPPAAAPQVAPAPTPQPQQTASALPRADSLPRNPPNGMLYAGSGKYQLYRQGDITWRLDTDTGWACVLFATDTQWARPRVYREGCRSSRATQPATGN